MSLEDEMRKAAGAISGGDKTKVARRGDVSAFCDHLKNVQNVRIEKIEHIKARHVAAFFKSEIERGLDKGTLQNVAGSIREVLRQAGREKLASLPEISNKALGIGGRSRAGTKTAMPGERFRELIGNLKNARRGCLCQVGGWPGAASRGGSPGG